MNDMKCCRLLIGVLADLPSPFRTVVATDYYDGPTEGFVECAVCGTVYAFRRIDADEQQNVRIFSLSPIVGHSLHELAEIETDDSGRRVIVLAPRAANELRDPVDELRRAASPEEFIMATEDIRQTIIAWRPVGIRENVDWFHELGLPRHSSGHVD